MTVGVVLDVAATLPADIVIAMEEFIDWFRPHVRDGLVIKVPDAPVIAASGVQAFGIFLLPHAPPTPQPQRMFIMVAGRIPEVLMEHGSTREDGIREALVTLAHECAHYEQWKTGKKVTERGVDQRANMLVREFHQRDVSLT